MSEKFKLRIGGVSNVVAAMSDSGRDERFEDDK